MSSPCSTQLAVLLAAGAGQRFTGPVHKLLAPFRGSPLAAHAISAVRQAGFGETAIVTGAVDLGDLTDGLTVLPNPHWQTGQRSSVVTAIHYARDNGYDALVIGLADQPFITAEAWTAVGSMAGSIVVATYDGVRGNPVKLSSDVWDLFLNNTHDADAGARSLMHLHPELVREVACKGNSADIDTPEDLAQWT